MSVMRDSCMNKSNVVSIGHNDDDDDFDLYNNNNSNSICIAP